MTRAAAFACAIAAAMAACGDNRGDQRVIDAVSGSRLGVFWYGYDDGTRQADLFALVGAAYDAAEHVPCDLRAHDGAYLCLPRADEAKFLDPACTEAVGIATTIAKPTHFIAYDLRRDGLFPTLVPARVYHADQTRSSPFNLYRLENGACIGPDRAPTSDTYWSILGEVDLGSEVAFHSETIGEGRLQARVLAGDDGTRLPLGLFDRERDQSCIAERLDDGTAVCAPGAIDTDLFGDPGCREARVAVDDEPPQTVAVTEPGGCYSFHAVAGQVEGPVYRRRGATCVATAITPGQKLYAVAATELDLPPLSIEPEAVAGRRLQRIVIGDGDVQMYDATRVYDTATGGWCEPGKFDGEASWRCVPSPVATVETVSDSPSCRGQIQIAAVPMHSCERSRFAVTVAPSYEVHAFADPMSGPLYVSDGSDCVPYVAPADTTLYRVGSAIEPKTFVRALHYGER